MDLSWHALNSMLQVKTLYHTEKQEFGYPWLSKKISRHTPQKPAELSPVSESQPTPLCSSGASATPQAFSLTPASYSH